MTALYAVLALAGLAALLYLMAAHGGPVGKGLVALLLTPVVLIVLGIAVGVTLGFAAGCAMPWVKRFQQQQTAPPVADPYNGALALAEKLPSWRWAPFLDALSKRWGIDSAIGKQAKDFLARASTRGVQ